MDVLGPAHPSPLFPAPWLGPDSGSSPTLLIAMPSSCPLWGRALACRVFQSPGKLLCEGRRITLDPETLERTQSFLCLLATQAKEDLWPNVVGGGGLGTPHLRRSPTPRFLCPFFSFSVQPDSQCDICFTNISCPPLSFPAPTSAGVETPHYNSDTCHFRMSTWLLPH